MEEILKVRGELERLRREGVLDEDVESAYWMLGQGQELGWAKEVVARYAKAAGKKVETKVALISREEHEKMMGREGPREVGKEEYERMMREVEGR